MDRTMCGHGEASPVSGMALDQSGEVHPTEGNAPSRLVLSQLRESSLAIAKAGGSLRPPEPERAIEEWKGLIAARWTLLDVCESDGCKYLVAQQNQPPTR